jgi:drug/metabolite transporter (DMT)-like permease
MGHDAMQSGRAKRRDTLMDKAILLAVAASACTAAASLCQRKGAKDNETAGFDARLLVRLARRPAWLLGIAAMIGGFIFQITALRFGDLSQVQPILAAELLFVFGYLAVTGTRRVTGRDMLAAVAMSAGIGVFLRLAAPSGGRLHAPGSAWLLAGLVTVGIVVVALALASGLARRPGASPSRRAAVLGAATGISWGFMAAVIKELSSHLGGGPGAVFSAWSLYLLLAAGAVTMLLASHALAAGPLAASQPGFTILDPLAASVLGVFLFGEHIRTNTAALAGEALALAVVIAGAAALSRSSLIAGENVPLASEHQPAAPAASSAASAPPATRPPADPADPPVPGGCQTGRPQALSPGVAVRAGRTLPGPAPTAAVRAGLLRPTWGNEDLDPEPAAA